MQPLLGSFPSDYRFKQDSCCVCTSFWDIPATPPMLLLLCHSSEVSGTINSDIRRSKKHSLSWQVFRKSKQGFDFPVIKKYTWLHNIPQQEQKKICSQSLNVYSLWLQREAGSETQTLFLLFFSMFHKKLPKSYWNYPRHPTPNHTTSVWPAAGPAQTHTADHLAGWWPKERNEQMCQWCFMATSAKHGEAAATLPISRTSAKCTALQ